MPEKIIRIGWIHDLFHDEDTAIDRSSDGKYRPWLNDGLRITTDKATYDFEYDFDSNSISYMNIESGDELDRIYTNGKSTIVLCTNGHKFVFKHTGGKACPIMDVKRREVIDLEKGEYHASPI